MAVHDVWGVRGKVEFIDTQALLVEASTVVVCHRACRVPKPILTVQMSHAYFREVQDHLRSSGLGVLSMHRKMSLTQPFRLLLLFQC